MWNKRLIARIENPLFAGILASEEGSISQMRVVVGQSGESDRIMLYWLVDELDGVIAEATFQAYGPPLLIGMGDAVCELLMRKRYDQARRIGGALEKMVPEGRAYLSLILEAVEEAARLCDDVPIEEEYTTPPPLLEVEEGQEYPGWKEKNKQEKIAILEMVLEKEIRPYVELDAGGVEILDLIEGKELIIAYKGNCTSCYSATGSTLTAIQQLLRQKVSPDLIVTPDIESLKFS